MKGFFLFLTQTLTIVKHIKEQEEHKITKKNNTKKTGAWPFPNEKKSFPYLTLFTELGHCICVYNES